jgi:hypothetical protein
MVAARGNVTHGGDMRRRHPWERWQPEAASPMAPARRRDQIIARVDRNWIELKQMPSGGQR